MYSVLAGIALLVTQGCAGHVATERTTRSESRHSSIPTLSREELETSTTGLYSNAPLTFEDVCRTKQRKHIAAGGTYVVEKGDSLYKISRRFKTSVEAIARANNIKDKTRIREGTILRIPEDAHAG